MDRYFDYAKKFFGLLRSHFDELDEFFSAEQTTDTVVKYRGRHGGSALFRPIGLHMFTQIISRATKELPLDEAVQLSAKLPRDLQMPPYDGLMWDQSSERIISLSRNRVTLREIMCYMIGRNGPRYTAPKLLESYRRLTGDEGATLPRQLI